MHAYAELGKELLFNPGLPDLFKELLAIVESQPEYIKHYIKLENYIISTGLAEVIRGSSIAPFVDSIFGCEFIEIPFSDYSSQNELPLQIEFEIS